MQASSHWQEVREYVSIHTGKLPSTDAQYLNAAKIDYNLSLEEQGKWEKGITPKSFAAGMTKRILNGWTPGDRKN